MGSPSSSRRKYSPPDEDPQTSVPPITAAAGKAKANKARLAVVEKAVRRAVEKANTDTAAAAATKGITKKATSGSGSVVVVEKETPSIMTPPPKIASTSTPLSRLKAKTKELKNRFAARMRSPSSSSSSVSSGATKKRK